MLTPLERVNNLLTDLRFSHVDFDALYTHLALSLAVQGLDLGYSAAFKTLDNLMTILKTEPFPKKRTGKAEEKWNANGVIEMVYLGGGGV